MKIVRIYNGADGKSTFEHVSLESRPELKTMQAATGIMFTSWPPGHFMDYHPAPRHQMVITLQGEMEIGLEDGTSERFGPGDVLIAEDLQGKGHTLRVTGHEQRISVSVPLAD